MLKRNFGTIAILFLVCAAFSPILMVSGCGSATATTNNNIMDTNAVTTNDVTNILSLTNFTTNAITYITNGTTAPVISNPGAVYLVEAIDGLTAVDYYYYSGGSTYYVLFSPTGAPTGNFSPNSQIYITNYITATSCYLSNISSGDLLDTTKLNGSKLQAELATPTGNLSQQWVVVPSVSNTFILSNNQAASEELCYSQTGVTNNAYVLIAPSGNSSYGYNWILQSLTTTNFVYTNIATNVTLTTNITILTNI